MKLVYKSIKICNEVSNKSVKICNEVSNKSVKICDEVSNKSSNFFVMKQVSKWTWPWKIWGCNIVDT